VDNLLVRIHFIIVMIRWTGLAPWEFEFPFPGSPTSTLLAEVRSTPTCVPQTYLQPPFLRKDVQGYLAHKKLPPPLDPRGGQFLMSEVPMYRCSLFGARQADNADRTGRAGGGLLQRLSYLRVVKTPFRPQKVHLWWQVVACSSDFLNGFDDPALAGGGLFHHQK